MIKRLLIVLCFAGSMSMSYSQEYVITDFGVSADSTKLNTAVIQAVIDKAEANGGGTVIIPKGVFLSGALFFKPGTKLLLKEGARLKGSDDIADYPLIPSRMEGRSIYYYAALINAYHVDSFQITGPGTIDGNGLKFWKEFWDHREAMRKIGKSSTNLEVHRPRLLFIWGCDHIVLRDVKLRNSGFWTTHLYQCNNVLIENCDIRAPFKPVPAPSSDGVDIDVCKNVVIRGCYISVNDDAVCIKGGKGPDAHKKNENGAVENILVENCDFGDSHGTLTLGSECIHGNNIVLRNCVVNNNTPILRLKMRPDTYQVYENIVIENITGKCGTVISMAPWRQFFDLGGSKEKPFAIVRNIIFRNINVNSSRFGEMEGNPADTVSNILFQNVTVVTPNPVLKTGYTGIKFENVTVNGSPYKPSR